MTNPKVSVIVPIFKAETTIRRCVDSLLGQSFKDYEIILVEDGSPDRCGAICDEYAHKDSRIKTIHKPNGGVSSARQCGIENARGEYTIHADPDDWVEPGMLEALYNNAKETNADMVICDMYEDTYKGQKLLVQKPTSLNHKDVLHDVFFRIHGSNCNKMIRRQLYEKYNIQFPIDLSFCEDQYVIASMLKHTIKVSYLPQAFYHYVRELNVSSLSRNYNENTYQQDLLRRNMFDELLKDEDIRQDVYNKNSYSIVSRAFYYGSQYYNSVTFKKRFGSYTDNVIKTGGFDVERSLIILSCKGLYKFAYSLLKTVLLIKHRLC